MVGATIATSTLIGRGARKARIPSIRHSKLNQSPFAVLHPCEWPLRLSKSGGSVTGSTLDDDVSHRALASGFVRSALRLMPQSALCPVRGLCVRTLKQFPRDQSLSAMVRFRRSQPGGFSGSTGATRSKLIAWKFLAPLASSPSSMKGERAKADDAVPCGARALTENASNGNWKLFTSVRLHASQIARPDIYHQNRSTTPLRTAPPRTINACEP